MENAGLYLLVQGGVGLVWQWARGPKRFPNWASWVVFGLAAVGGYVWATPDALGAFRADWRTALFALASFVLAARGAASSSSEARIAPKTNSQ